ncbi:MAG TPA: adenylate/guanylate cyclase domain-containing protein [Methylomirabilota bacterium]|nr:adenylate/guanylate cyclase domain-containing protein [Methylomirabilota bacterium]
MNCSQCQAENREGARFCRECGALFAPVCSSCGAKVEAGSTFCDNCGTPLAATPTPTPEPLHLVRAEAATAEDFTEIVRASKSPAEAQRRQLTVMFCDLVGSTELAARVDPEVLRDVVRSYQQVCDAVIRQLHGNVAQYLGDGLLVYFGYPVASEDDPRRAVRAGLGIIEAIATLNARLQREKGITLAVRVGIHTGLVVIGEIGGASRREELALGETPNVAARLQAIAESDTVVISAATHRLLRGSVMVTDLGAQVVKGLPAPLRAYRVQGDGGAANSLEASAAEALTPLVGRDQEVGLLLDRWEHVKDGRGHVVLLSGEPGIGKSRLVRVLKDHIAAEGYLGWECRCSPYHQDSALYPLIDLFERALQFDRDDAPPERVAKIEARLVRYGLAQPEAVSLWAAFLSVAVPDQHPPLNLTPQRQKEKTFEAIVAQLLALAAEQPLLFIVEDLHWADPSTRELVDFVFGQVPAASILMLMTSRPEFRPPWAHRSHFTYLTVNRVTRKQTELMVERVTGGKSLPAEVLQQVVAKTDGVPLFVEELTRMVLESGLLRDQGDRYELTEALPPLAIPSTLQDSLMARLDRLGTVKEVAQVGAALGRTFPYELLRAIASIDDRTLQAALEKLGESDLLHQRGVPPDATYIFKHALIQETAYQSMLMSRRKQLHTRIADTLVERFPGTTGTQPELVAHHYTEAGLADQAVDYWQRAGQRAVERSANLEGIAHFTKGLNVLATLPDSRDRREREVALRTALGPALMSTKGLGAREVEQNYTQALALCRQLGGRSELFAVLRGLWEFHELRGDLKTALELAEELFRLALAVDDDAALRLVAHDVLGDTLYWLGEFTRSLEHLERGIELYRSDEHRVLAHQHAGYDPGVACRSFSAVALWYLGYPDRAVRRNEEAIALARELSQTFSMILAVEFGAVVRHLRREAPLAKACAETDIALSTEQGNAFFLGCGMVEQGWAIAQEGQVDEGLALIVRGMDVCRSSGAVLELPHCWASLAEAYRGAGRIEEALQAVAEGLTHARETSARFNEAELYRLKGELLLAGAGPGAEDAERCFRQAVEIARHQSAKSLELRAATSLSRLLQRQGKREDARRLLAEVYAWFTEGFDTADLKDARALLDALAID